MRLPRTYLFTAALAISMSTSALSFALPAGCPGGSPTPGTITLTDKKLEPSQASSAKDLKTGQVCSIAKAEGDDGWKLHVIAHLNRAPGTDEVSIVLYDQTPTPGAAPHDPVQAYKIRTAKNGKVMMAEIEIKPEEGFKATHKYHVLIARLLNNGKEEVFARTTLELK